MHMTHQPGNGPVQISAEDIQARIQELARRIEADHAGHAPHMICVLNGAFPFFADLMRAVNLPVTVDFLQASSYGEGQETSGEVKLVKDLQFPIAGRRVIVVEDIVDTGLTLKYLMHYLQNRSPESLQIASLLSKPARRRAEITIDYLGFTIPNAYVYGFGLDRAQLDRNLPFITSQETDGEDE